MKRSTQILDSLRRSVGPRGRTIVHTGAWAIIAKACGAANLFISIPFVLHALGPEQFGAWATLASLVGLAGFLDFGFGNGTMNLVAGAHGRGAQDEVATILHEGLRALWRIAGWVALVSVACIAAIPWYRALGLPESFAGDSRSAAAIVLGTITLGIPLNMAARAQLGLNRGDRVYKWQSFGSLLTLVVVIACARTGGSLPWLVAAAISTPLIASLANTIDLHRFRAGTVPARSSEIADRIRREGMLFFVLQLAVALAFTSDLPLISAMRGPTEAGNYAIVQRLFSVIPMGLSLLWIPLWPIYRQALASGDHDWVMRTLRWSLLLATLAALGAGLVLAFGFERIIVIWIERPLAISGWLLAGFVVWHVLNAFGNGIAALMNAASIVKFQVIVAIIFSAVCLAGKVLLLTQFDASFLPWITSVAYFLAVTIPTLLFARRIFHESLRSGF